MQCDNICDKNFANLVVKVKSIMKYTVKSQSIKRKQFCLTLLIECELTAEALNLKPSPQLSSKRFRQPNTIEFRSPPNSHRAKNMMEETSSQYKTTQNKTILAKKGYLFISNNFGKMEFFKKSLYYFSRFWKNGWIFTGTQLRSKPKCSILC